MIYSKLTLERQRSVYGFGAGFFTSFAFKRKELGWQLAPWEQGPLAAARWLGVSLLQKLLNHTTGPGLAARILVHSVQHVVQNSAPADRLVECTADWVVVLYLPCLGVDFFVQPYRRLRLQNPLRVRSH